MMPMVQIDVQTDDAMELLNAMQRAQSQLGKGLNEALRWTAYAWSRSLGGMTRKSETQRKIVKNPDPRHKTDARMAPWGVMGYKKGVETFIPIYRTGEYGRIRFVDRRTMEIKYLNKATGKVHRADRYEQTPDLSIKTDRRRKIGRSGLAKKSWMGLQSRMASGGSVNAMGVAAVGSVQWTGGSEVRITNHLRYIRRAVNGGDSAVTRAAASAASWLNARVDQELAKRLKGIRSA
jgi:hypothetical protein